MEDGDYTKIEKPKVTNHLWIYTIQLIAVAVLWLTEALTLSEMIFFVILNDIAYNVDCFLCERRNKGK